MARIHTVREGRFSVYVAESKFRSDYHMPYKKTKSFSDILKGRRILDDLRPISPGET